MYANNSNRVGQDTSPKTAREPLTPPREVGEIGAQAQRLQTIISCLAISIEQLATRLEPILHSPSPANPDGLTVGPRDTEMGQFLLNSNEQLERLDQFILDIKSRVAL